MEVECQTDFPELSHSYFSDNDDEYFFKPDEYRALWLLCYFH